MGQDLPDNHLIAGEGVCFESYMNMPGQVPEAELITEIWVPLKD
jgi:DNA gyrase inhibitor GyrI